MSDFQLIVKVFMKFVRYGDTDKETPYPDEVKWLKEGVKRNAKYLTDSELKLMYGWTMDSRMPSVYIHLSGVDLDQKYQQVYGSGKPAEPPKPSFSPTVCPRCGDKGAPGMRFCPKCATPRSSGEGEGCGGGSEDYTRDIGAQETRPKEPEPSSFRRRERIEKWGDSSPPRLRL